MGCRFSANVVAVIEQPAILPRPTKLAQRVTVFSPRPYLPRSTKWTGHHVGGNGSLDIVESANHHNRISFVENRPELGINRFADRMQRAVRARQRPCW